MAGYRLSVEALSDLENIWFYGAEQWGMDQADEYSLKLEKTILIVRILHQSMDAETQLLN